jgi:hypothetical protein
MTYQVKVRKWQKMAKKHLKKGSFGYWLEGNDYAALRHMSSYIHTITRRIEVAPSKIIIVMQ